MNGTKVDPDVKVDADAMTPSGSGYMDDDFYEDTGELTLPSRADKDVWVTRIPKWLYEAVSNFDELAAGNPDDEIEIGQVVATRDPTDVHRLDKSKPMGLFLNSRALAEKKIPQAFELQPTAATGDVLGNTYVFTEKDLPGYKGNAWGPNRGSRPAVADPNARIQRKPYGRYKKAIPKQTTLVGATTREYNAVPLPTRDYIDFAKQRNRVAMQGHESHTNIVENMNEHVAAGNTQRLFKNFIQATTPARTQLNKAARIPKNELIDMLHALFDKYHFWPMKALKQHTHQPEAYLKEILPDIAVLVKAGPFASNWKRNNIFDEHRNLTHQAQVAAPVLEGEDQDDEMEMEDVL